MCIRDRSTFDQLEELLVAVQSSDEEKVLAMLPMVALWHQEADALDAVLEVTDRWLALSVHEDVSELLPTVVTQLSECVVAHAPLLVEQLAVSGAVSPVLLDSLVACQRAADAAATGLKHNKVKRMAAALDQKIAAQLLRNETRERSRALRTAPTVSVLQECIGELQQPGEMLPDLLLATGEQLQQDIGLLAQRRLLARYGIGGTHRGPSTPVHAPCTVLAQLDSTVATLQGAWPEVEHRQRSTRQEVHRARLVLQASGVQLSTVDAVAMLLTTVKDAIIDDDEDGFGSSVQLQLKHIASQLEACGHVSAPLLYLVHSLAEPGSQGSTLEAAVEGAWPVVGRLMIEHEATVALRELLASLESFLAGGLSVASLEPKVLDSRLLANRLLIEQTKTICSQQLLSALLTSCKDQDRSSAMTEVPGALQALIEVGSLSGEHGTAMGQVSRELAMVSQGFGSEALDVAAVHTMAQCCSAVAVQLRASGAGSSGGLEELIVCTLRLMRGSVPAEQLQPVLSRSRVLARKLKAEANMVRRSEMAVLQLPSGLQLLAGAGQQVWRCWAEQAGQEQELHSESETKKADNVSMVMNSAPESLFSAIGSYHQAAHRAWGAHRQPLTPPELLVPNTAHVASLQRLLGQVSELAARKLLPAQVLAEWPEEGSAVLAPEEIATLAAMLPTDTNMLAWQRAGHQEALGLLQSKQLLGQPGFEAISGALQAGSTQAAFDDALCAWGELAVLLADAWAHTALGELKMAVLAHEQRCLRSEELLAHVQQVQRRCSSVVSCVLDWRTDQQTLAALCTLCSEQSQEHLAAAELAGAALPGLEAQAREAEALQQLSTHLDRYLHTPWAMRTVQGSITGFAGLQQSVSTQSQLAMELEALRKDNSTLLAALVCACKAQQGHASSQEIEACLAAIGRSLLILGQLPDCTVVAARCAEVIQGQVHSSVQAVGVQAERERCLIGLRHSHVVLGLLSELQQGPQPVQPRGSDQTAAAKAWGLMDQNQDGEVSLSEISTYLRSTAKSSWPEGLQDLNPFMTGTLTERMRQMDANQDGVLSKSEFEAWWSEHN
eukprot:TRINITY_DN18996_c0_g1_i2.p1 TRINITY_DN18996_c0_g1~~TRINITY_DN18996_c0_g1_i2.p1  ORF type:complete len:1065 (-),score=376.67 TRINITY_DN18996_c0_g1_i2:275-3469(-)